MSGVFCVVLLSLFVYPTFVNGRDAVDASGESFISTQHQYFVSYNLFSYLLIVCIASTLSRHLVVCAKRTRCSSPTACMVTPLVYVVFVFQYLWTRYVWSPGVDDSSRLAWDDVADTVYSLISVESPIY